MTSKEPGRKFAMDDARKAEDALAEKWVKEQAARIHAISAADIRAVADLVYWSHVQGQRDAGQKIERLQTQVVTLSKSRRDILKYVALLEDVANAARGMTTRNGRLCQAFQALDQSEKASKP